MARLLRKVAVYVTLPRHIIFWVELSLLLLLRCCMINREATITNFYVFGLARMEIEHTIPHSRPARLPIHHSSEYQALERYVCVVSKFKFTCGMAILKLKQSKNDPFRKGLEIQLYKLDNFICP